MDKILIDSLNYANSKLKINPIESRRVFHGRGKNDSNLNFITVDWFNPVIFITTYKELKSNLIESFKEIILQTLKVEIKAIVLQQRSTTPLKMDIIYGELPKELHAIEQDLIFKIDLTKNQNIGFFLDMKNGREIISKSVKDKSVLNLFAYTCSFSVVAKKHGAKKIVNIDMFGPSLNIGRENHRINNLDLKDISFFPHNIKKSWNLLKREGPYNLIIVDPPTKQFKSFDVEKDYKALIKRVIPFLSERGEILACLNSPHLKTDFIKNIFYNLEENFKLIETKFRPVEFFEQDNELGLKILLFKKLNH